MADKKHMDIAKPGTAEPQTGGKPMVIGHKKVIDTAVKPADEVVDATDESVAADEPDVETAPKKKVDIQPLSDPKEVAPKDPEETEQPQEDANDKKDDVKAKETSDETQDEASDEESISEIDKEKQRNENKDATDEAKAHRLQELTESKEYFVPIKEAHHGNVRVFIMVFIASLVVISIALLALLDAEVLDIGITPPTNFID